MRTWIKVTAALETQPEDWGAWVEVFDRFGIPSTEQTDRPPTLSGYFPEDHPVNLDGLSASLNEFAKVQVSTVAMPEEEWADAWKQFFKPRRVGRSWVIKPTWESCEAQLGDRVIELDPGQAFGTGDHPTTRMCLELLEDVELRGSAIADIGCGSGILAVAAKLAGAHSVVAIDHDPIAIEATVDNAERNHVDIEVICGDGFKALTAGRSFDVVLSNIISATLINVAHQASSVLQPGGKWIVSGIIDDNWEDVRLAGERAGLKLVATKAEDRWVAATFSR